MIKYVHTPHVSCPTWFRRAKLELITSRNALVGKLLGKATNCPFSRAACNAVAQLRDFFSEMPWVCGLVGEGEKLLDLS